MVTRGRLSSVNLHWKIWKIARGGSLWSWARGSWTKWLTREHGYVLRILLVSMFHERVGRGRKEDV